MLWVRRVRKQVALVIHEHLGLVFEAAECAGMNDAITVALEFAATVWCGFCNFPSARIGLADGVRRELSHKLTQIIY